MQHREIVDTLLRNEPPISQEATYWNYFSKQNLSTRFMKDIIVFIISIIALLLLL